MKDDQLDAIVARVPQPSGGGDCMDDGILQHYRGGSLEPARALEVERHLAQCTDCRALLAALAEPVSPALERWAVSSLKKRGVPIWLPAAAALLIAFGSALLWSRSTGVPEYEAAQISGGVQTMRHDRAPHGHVFSPNGELKIILRPKSEYQGPELEVVARVDGRVVP